MSCIDDTWLPAINISRFGEPRALVGGHSWTVSVIVVKLNEVLYIANNGLDHQAMYLSPAMYEKANSRSQPGKWCRRYVDIQAMLFVAGTVSFVVRDVQEA